MDTPANANIGTLGLSVIFSFVFSAPLVAFVWFIALLARLSDKKGNELFQFILGTAFSCASAAAFIFVYTLGAEFIKARFVVGLSIIVSALAAILVFRKQIKTNE